MARTQKNKATNAHLGILKAKLAKLRQELINPKGGGGSTAGEGFDVAKTGDARIGFVGEICLFAFLIDFDKCTIFKFFKRFLNVWHVTKIQFLRSTSFLLRYPENTRRRPFLLKDGRYENLSPAPSYGIGLTKICDLSETSAPLTSVIFQIFRVSVRRKVYVVVQSCRCVL